MVGERATGKETALKSLAHNRSTWDEKNRIQSMEVIYLEIMAVPSVLEPSPPKFLQILPHLDFLSSSFFPSNFNLSYSLLPLKTSLTGNGKEACSEYRFCFELFIIEWKHICVLLSDHRPQQSSTLRSIAVTFLIRQRTFSYHQGG